ncbi:glutamate permease [Salmonella enterica subsp. enterica serovar Enteritidis]|nr:glutamate permease [Salmonella enterica subsp. enterica serovar Enteritidis]
MFELDTLSTLVAATLVLLLGRKLVQSVSLLKKYTIPEPVAGGLLVAVALLVLKKSVGWEVNFDMTLRDPLMLAFFATIGLNANLASLRKGGRVVGVFLVVVVGLLLMQNAIGIGMASLLGLDPLMGLIAGSITLSGGHGTGAAWSKLFVERYGFANATEVAMACATFGLVLGGLIGGPVARYLVKHSTTPDGMPDDQAVPTAFEKPDVGRMITSLVLIETIALIAICLTVGKIVAQLLAGTVLELPVFVCVLFVGVILSNGLALVGFYRVFERAVSVLGEREFVTVPGNGADEPEAVGTGVAGAADAGDSGGTDHLHGAVRDLRHLAHDGEKLRCGGAGGGSLRFWPGRNADRHC